MPAHRMILDEPDLLRRLMARAAKPITDRDLAEKAGVSKSKISALLTGDRPTVDPATANRIAEAVGTQRSALFQPLESISMDVHAKEDNSVTPTEKSLRMRLASHKSWAKTPDRSARTEAARKASHQTRFLRQAREENPTATEQQLQQIADSLKKAFYTELAIRSAAARRSRRAATTTAKQARIEAELSALDDPAA